MNEALDFNWIRQIRLKVSGLVDRNIPNFGTLNIAGHGNKTLEADGSMSKYRIDAFIRKSVRVSVASGIIHIWNLSADTRNGFVRDKTKITIDAGWKYGPNSGMRSVFTGMVLASDSRRHGEDIVTTVHVHSGQAAAAKAFVMGSYKMGTPYKNIVLQIAESMRPYGVTVSPSLVIGVKGEVGTMGFSFAGKASTVLTRLSQEAGFYWSIVDDCFQTVSRNPEENDGALKSPAVVKRNELIGVSPQYGGVRQRIIGVTCESVLNTGILPGREVEIQSSVDASTRGVWRATDVEHRLSCHVPRSFITMFSGKARRVTR